MTEHQEYKAKLLKELYAPYVSCTLCPLSQQRNIVVFGRGNPDAKMLLIGEGPGRNEDLEGSPFVGRSGKLLSKTLETLKIPEPNLYITNIVKCRPPQNRAPLAQEVATCKDLLLDKQIAIIQPVLICTLGASALTTLFNTQQGITFLRGKTFLYKNIPVFPTYHPAYILRSPSKLTLFTQDLKNAYFKSNSI